MLMGVRNLKASGSFADRRAAGRALAKVLARKNFNAPVVLALPRGGVAVAAEIARALKAPLDIVLVRKIGVPIQPELAAAAVVDGGAPEIVTNTDVVELAGVSREYIDGAVKRELEEINRRRRVYLQGRSRVPLEGRTVVLVDDGIATGASVRAALRALKRKGPKALVLAVPVAPFEAVNALRAEVDDVVCLSMPEPFLAIGIHYVDFHQMSDAEVVELLAEADQYPSQEPPAAA
jgi:putative phosphoribosyl transferase